MPRLTCFREFTRSGYVCFSLLMAASAASGAITGLTPVPSTVQFYSGPNDTTPKTNPAPVVIATGSGSASLTVSVSQSGPSSVNWLKTAYLSNASISAGGQVGVTITVDPTGLPANGDPLGTSYHGQVVVSTGTVSATFNVTITTYPGTAIQLTPVGQVTSAQVGGSSSTFNVGFAVTGATQSTAVTGGAFAYPVSLTSNASWLSAAQTSNISFAVTANPAGMVAGTYSGAITVSNCSTNTGNQANNQACANANEGAPFMAAFGVTFTVGAGSSQGGALDQTSLSFNLSAGGTPSQQTVNVSSGTSVFFTVMAATNSGGNWLQASPPTGTAGGGASAPVTVTATPGSLAPGNYSGAVQITLGTQVYTVSVSLTLTATAALQTSATAVALSTQLGGTCTPQSVPIQSSDPSIPLPFTVTTPVTTPAFGAWLTATPSSGNAPASISVSCNATGVLAGSYSATLVVKSVAATNGQISVPVTLLVSTNTPPSTTQTISHIADGGGWKSTAILVNTDTAPAAYTVNFWNEAARLSRRRFHFGSETGTIPVGGSATIHTADSDPKNLSEGWAEVISGQAMGGTAIFRLDAAGQEAAVPLLTAGG